MDPIATSEINQEILCLLQEARTIAVVGIKSGPQQDAYRVPAYMLDHGYTIIPINPKLTRVLDRKVYSSLSEIPTDGPPIDIVNIFRASENVAAHVDEILALCPLPRAVWTQLGIRHEPSAERLRAAGIEVIQDRCLMVDHDQLLGHAKSEIGVRSGQLQIQVHYDFASSLCYVAHRVMERLRGFLADLELELAWTPIDLARLTGWRRNDPVDSNRVEHVRQLAKALHVELQAPGRWIDSRPGAAIALALGRQSELDSNWREAVFSSIYQEGRRPDCDEDWMTLLHSIRGEATSSELMAAAEELQSLTRAAAEQSVTGVPTFMLGPWPLGGIQDEETMRSLLGRWARKQRSVN